MHLHHSADIVPSIFSREEGRRTKVELKIRSGLERAGRSDACCVHLPVTSSLTISIGARSELFDFLPARHRQQHLLPGASRFTHARFMYVVRC